MILQAWAFQDTHSPTALHKAEADSITTAVNHFLGGHVYTDNAYLLDGRFSSSFPQNNDYR